jgi:hypothetical protein
MRRLFRGGSRYLADLLAAAVAAAAPARAAVTSFSDPADATFFPTGTLQQISVSTLGARTSGDPGSRTVVYVFQLPQSDTGIPQVKSATFGFTFADPASRTPILATPTTYDVDLYALPARSEPTVLFTDSYLGPSTGAPASDVLITPSLLPRNQAYPVGEFARNYDAGSGMVSYLNAQYGQDGSGTGKYIFLRLTDNQPAPSENSGGYVYMGENPTNRPYLTLTFVPEPSLVIAGTVLLAATTLRRRPRHRRRQD